MHEAETLCSRIGILINGRFQCIGTPQYLKKKYGEGYRIVVDTLEAQKVREEVMK